MFKMVKTVFYFLKGILKIYCPFLPAEQHLLDGDIFVPISKCGDILHGSKVQGSKKSIEDSL
jgi:hypothetical protein